jgi:hypothetical protein
MYTETVLGSKFPSSLNYRHNALDSSARTSCWDGVGPAGQLWGTPVSPVGRRAVGGGQIGARRSNA